MKINVTDLVKKYNEERVLDNLNITVDNVQSVVLLGKSGSGKSTLLKVLSGIENYDEGTVKINDEDVNTRVFKDKIGFVFQTGSLFSHLTLLDNIVLILEKIKKVDKVTAINKVEALFKQFSLIEHKDKYPHMLSGGQQQRAVIVRSLAIDAQLLFLDEPTSALDPILTFEVLSTIRKLKELNKKFVIVTHEIAFAKEIADYVIFLEDGKIVEEGTKKILEQPKTEQLKTFLSMVL